MYAHVCNFTRDCACAYACACAHARTYSSVERVPHAQGRAIDRLLEYGANTKIHACEKRFAGHALVKHNSELLMAKIKQRQAQG